MENQGKRMNQGKDIDKTNAMIQALDNTGVCMFMYYPQTKTITIPKNTCETYRCKDFYDNMPHSFADDFVLEDDYDTFKEMYYKIDRGEKTAATTFHSKDLNYCTHVTLTTVSWTDDGHPEDVFGLIENRSDYYNNEKLVHQLKEELAKHGRTDELDDALKTMAISIGSQYFAVYHIWLESHTYVCFQEQLDGILELIGEKGQYEPAWDAYIKGYIDERDQASVREFIEITTLAERIGHKNSITIVYRRKEIGWTRGQFIVGKRDENGMPLTVIYTVTDINEEVENKIQKQEAEEEALRDPLTKLWNRKAFDQFKEQKDYKNNPTAILLYDIDRFKGINDQYGHEIGDQVIVEVSQAVSGIMRQKDLIFRMGGDEFAVLLYNCNHSVWQTICRKIETIHANLKQVLPFEMNVTISAGLCVNESGYCDEMYNLADRAMYNTKTNGRGGCSFIDLEGNITSEWHDSSGYLRKGDVLEKNSTVTWRMEIPKNRELPARVYGDDLYIDFLGIDKKASPEEVNRVAMSRLDPEYKEIADAAVTETIKCGQAEAIYLWNHPEKLKKRNPEEIFHHVFSMKANNLMSEEEIIDTMKTLNEAHRANYFIRIPDQSYVVLKDLLSDSADDKMEYAYKNAQDMIDANIRAKVKDEYQKAMFEFADLSTLTKRMANVDTIKYEYQNVLNIWCVAALSTVKRENGVVTQVDFRVSELTYDRAEAQELLQMQKEAIATLSSSELIFISIIDKETGASRVIQSKNMINTNRIFDFDEAMKREASHFIASDQEEFLKNVTLERINEKLEKNGRYDSTVFLQLPDNGAYRRVSYHFIYNKKFPKYILSTTEDITEEYVRDKVTGMNSFNGFRMDCMYEFSRFDSQQYVVINFNIVNFKAVNTMYGYESGNWLLKTVLTNLSEAEVPFVSVCRENADNFFCLCRKEEYDYDALNKLCKMQVSDDNGLTEKAELFCGVYFINRNEEFDVICDKARIARRHAEREIGVNIYELNEVAEQKYLDEAAILATISGAIQKGEMVVYYQPIYDAQNGKMSSAEALVRWQHPEKGLIPPNVFIPAVERTGQIAEIDVYVGNHVQQFQKERLISGKKMIPISINVSRYDFLQQKYMNHALSFMQDNPEIANMIRIEITESGLINIPSYGETFMHEMRSMGIQTMIDDFGTGYSSLASIVDRPCDIIKLDMTFARHIGVKKNMEILVRSAIETAHYLGVKVVAEGVETKEQYEFLKDNGCDYIQGFYFSKPLPEAEFMCLLEKE